MGPSGRTEAGGCRIGPSGDRPRSRPDLRSRVGSGSVARLVCLKDGARFPVPARCLIGRAPICALPIGDAYASSEHAKLSWSGGHWELRDLGSRNGTFVDGRRVEPGVPVPITAGAKLGFGEPEAGWTLEDDQAPSMFAQDLGSHEVKESTDGLLVLPSEDAPQVSCYRDPQGSGWVAEGIDGEVRHLEDEGVVVAGGRSWRLALPLVADATPMVDVAFALPNVSLRLGVTPDEERIELGLVLRGKATWLEPREHGYLLLTLARAREKDRGLPLDQRGWVTVDRLIELTKLDENAINVLTHRARKQLAAVGLEGAAGIVETRRGARRLGTDRFQIEAVPL